MKLRPLLFLAIVIFAFSCSNNTKTTGTENVEIGKLQKWMIGTFSSAEQSAADDSYFDITLHMYPIWQGQADEDEFYLYMEQAVTFTPTKPYRQRIYHIQKTGGNEFKNEIYQLPNKDELVGAFSNPGAFKNLKPQDLVVEKGCAVHLAFEEGAFRGGTEEDNCENELQGASFATSEVVIENDQIYTWDRGFDEDENQVWGAEEGGYVFKKVSSQPDRN